MKIYRKVVMDLNGNTLHEDSYDYTGAVALCFGGGDAKRAQKASQEAADRSYNLQLAEIDKQDKMLAEAKRKQTEEELQKKLGMEGQLQAKRTGASATILTDQDYKGEYTGVKAPTQRTIYDQPYVAPTTVADPKAQLAEAQTKIPTISDEDMTYTDKEVAELERNRFGVNKNDPESIKRQEAGMAAYKKYQKSKQYLNLPT